jgi:DNA-binding MarR family transcriptional regulator
MPAIAKLLTQKHQLIERLHEGPGPEEREQIERQLEQINAALDSLEQAGSGASG